MKNIQNLKSIQNQLTKQQKSPYEEQVASSAQGSSFLIDGAPLAKQLNKSAKSGNKNGKNNYN